MEDGALRTRFGFEEAIVGVRLSLGLVGEPGSACWGLKADATSACQDVWRTRGYVIGRKDFSLAIWCVQCAWPCPS